VGDSFGADTKKKTAATPTARAATVKTIGFDTAAFPVPLFFFTLHPLQAAYYASYYCRLALLYAHTSGLKPGGAKKPRLMKLTLRQKPNVN
jgi:hypothetical protein